MIPFLASLDNVNVRLRGVASPRAQGQVIMTKVKALIVPV